MLHLFALPRTNFFFTVCGHLLLGVYRFDIRLNIFLKAEFIFLFELFVGKGHVVTGART